MKYAALNINLKILIFSCKVTSLRILMSRMKLRETKPMPMELQKKCIETEKNQVRNNAAVMCKVTQPFPKQKTFASATFKSSSDNQNRNR